MLRRSPRETRRDATEMVPRWQPPQYEIVPTRTGLAATAPRTQDLAPQSIQTGFTRPRPAAISSGPKPPPHFSRRAPSKGKAATTQGKAATTQGKAAPTQGKASTRSKSGKAGKGTKGPPRRKQVPLEEVTSQLGLLHAMVEERAEHEEVRACI